MGGYWDQIVYILMLFLGLYGLSISTGLYQIKYRTEAGQIRGEARRLRARKWAIPLSIALIVAAFVLILDTQGQFD